MFQKSLQGALLEFLALNSGASSLGPRGTLLFGLAIRFLTQLGSDLVLGVLARWLGEPCLGGYQAMVVVGMFGLVFGFMPLRFCIKGFASASWGLMVGIL